MLSAVLTIGRESIAGYCLYGDSQLKAAEYIYENSEPEDTVLTDMRHNNEIAALTGRNIVCGSTSYVYFHGLRLHRARNGHAKYVLRTAGKLCAL